MLMITLTSEPFSYAIKMIHVIDVCNLVININTVDL